MMRNQGCPYCEGGCAFCGYTGMAPFDKEDLRAARESGIEFFEVDLTEHLPEVSLAETKRAIAKLRAEERGIRIATIDGREVPDPNKRKLR